MFTSYLDNSAGTAASADKPLEISLSSDLQYFLGEKLARVEVNLPKSMRYGELHFPAQNPTRSSQMSIVTSPPPEYAGKKPSDFDSRWADEARAKRYEPCGYVARLQKRVIVQLNPPTEELPVVQNDTPVVSRAVSTGKSHCLSCRKETYTRNSDIVRTKNGRQRITGECAECARKKSSFIKG